MLIQELLTEQLFIEIPMLLLMKFRIIEKFHDCRGSALINP